MKLKETLRITCSEGYVNLEELPTGIKPVRNENGDLLVHCHSVLNRWKKLLLSAVECAWGQYCETDLS